MEPVDGEAGTGAETVTALLVHGGAWDIPDAEVEAHRAGVREAVERGRAMLEAGEWAVDVVVEVVASMEADGAFDSGRGAVLTREGRVELDAGVMDGESLAFGAVAGVRRYLHPSRIASRLLATDGEARFLIGDGAERFARDAGFEAIDPRKLICARERRRRLELLERIDHHPSHAFLAGGLVPRGTVGCVARDARGRLAAATSTGGTPLRPSGRVGDSPLPGAGFYAGAAAAASATGWGEAIAAAVLCARAVDAVAAGVAPRDAATRRLAAMRQAIRNRDGDGATGGLILLGRRGAGAVAFTAPKMARGGWSGGGEAWSACDAG